MGGPTTHPPGVTLASGDPSNSLTARWGWDGSCCLEAAAPGFILVAGRGRVLAGEEGVGGLVGQDSWTRRGLLLCTGSSEGALRQNPVRCGGWERQVAVEGLQRLERG